MERGLRGECHSGASASAEDHWWLFSFPAIGVAVGALVGSLVKVLGVLPDLDDYCQRNLIKVPIRVAVQFAVRVRVTDHCFCSQLVLKKRGRVYTPGWGGTTRCKVVDSVRSAPRLDLLVHRVGGF